MPSPPEAAVGIASAPGALRPVGPVAALGASSAVVALLLPTTAPVVVATLFLTATGVSTWAMLLRVLVVLGFVLLLVGVPLLGCGAVRCAVVLVVATRDNRAGLTLADPHPYTSAPRVGG